MTTTDSVRSRLEAYRSACREYDLQINRLEQKRQEVGDVKSPTFEALPTTVSSSDPNARKVLELMRLEERISSLREWIEDEHETLELYIQRMTNAEQRMVLRMRYFDGMEWPDITFVYYGDRVDYVTEEDSYKHRLYDIHTRAVTSLASTITAKLSTSTLKHAQPCRR